MKHFKSIQWFLTEIPRLRSEGILDESTADRLEKFYRKELESPSVRNLLFGILGVLGAMLIAGGIVLFTAHNWDMLPKQGRIAIAFLPFLLSAAFAAFTLIRRKGEVWREGAAVLSAAGIVSLNALISQIYHIEGEMFDFLSLNLLFALALMYLFDSRVLSLLTAIFLIVFAVSDGAAGWTIFLPPVYTLFWIPFAVCRLRKSVSIPTRYAAIAAAIALLCTRQADAAVLFPLAAAFFFCGGLNLLLDAMWYFLIYHYVVGEDRFIDLGLVYMSAPIASLFLVFPITFFTGFWLNRNIAFRSSPLRTRTQLFRYALSVGGAVLLNYLCMKLFVEVFDIWPTPAKLVTSALSALYSFLAARYFTFRGAVE